MTSGDRQPLHLLLRPSPHPDFFSHHHLPQLILPAINPSILLIPHHAGDQDTLPVLLMVGHGFLCIVVGLQKRMNASRTFFKKRGIKRHVSSPLRLSGVENTSEGRVRDHNWIAGKGAAWIQWWDFWRGSCQDRTTVGSFMRLKTLKTNKWFGHLSRLIGQSQGLHQATVSIAMVFSEDVEPHSVHPPGTTTAPLFQTRGPPGQSPRSDGVTYNERSSSVHASPARAYLRHIASAPNIPQRRVPREHAPPPVIKKSTLSLKDGLNAPSPPPMPPSWLETVARAVLGFHGSHIRRDDTAYSPRQSRFVSPTHPAGRSSAVRGHGRSTRKRQTPVFEDTAAKQRGRSLLTSPISSQPPNMLAARSQASLGEVIKLNVVCRSAPTSRSSSVARRKPRDASLATASLGNLSNGSVRGKSKALQSTSRNIRAKTGRNCGPNLRDQVEDGSTSHTRGERDVYDSSSEDEDEDEVDLSKLLVPPRRQQSIKSLRRQLSRSQCGDGNASGIAGTWTVRGDDDSALTPDDRGRIRRGSVNDGDWGVLVPPGSYRDSRTSDRRREIPVSWKQQGGSSGDKLPRSLRHRER
jgi:hypothetical protein